jgi:RNA polymerase-binding transcription factor DksA
MIGPPGKQGSTLSKSRTAERARTTELTDEPTETLPTTTAMKKSTSPKENGSDSQEKSGRMISTSDALGPAGGKPTASRSVPGKWRWHQTVLLNLQDRLIEQHGELRHAVTEPLETHSLSEADSATDEFDHNLALTQLAGRQDALNEVSAALGRMQNGSYGVCEATGQTIPEERLKVVPWTRFIREVEARLEQENVVRWVRMNKVGTARNGGQLWLAPEDEMAADSAVTPADETLTEVFTPPGQHIAAPPDMKTGKRTEEQS